MFQNTYVSFEVPDNWICQQEGVAWICSPQSPVEAKEAIIVLVAKVAGPEDNLDSFLNLLKQPKKIVTKAGMPMPSHVSYAQKRMLAGSTWVQAQHLGSEVQDYYTLYLATVKDQLSILVSFSAEKSYVKKYNGVFDKAMKTITLLSTKKLLLQQTGGGVSNEVIGIQTGSSPFGTGEMNVPINGKGTRGKGLLVFMILGALILAVVGYMLATRTKKKPSKGKKKSSPPTGSKNPPR
jgi:hypothetical protein